MRIHLLTLAKCGQHCPARTGRRRRNAGQAKIRANPHHRRRAGQLRGAISIRPIPCTWSWPAAAIIELAPGFAPSTWPISRPWPKAGSQDGRHLPLANNFVVQFGDPDGEEAGKAKPYPAGTQTHLPAEFTRSDSGVHFDRPARCGWLGTAGRLCGWLPGGAQPQDRQVWITHCYGTLGAGRSNAPDNVLAPRCMSSPANRHVHWIISSAWWAG